jgi:ParB family chromosome partitioning protein
MADKTPPKRLGRGLGSLISSGISQKTIQATKAAEVQKEKSKKKEPKPEKVSGFASEFTEVALNQIKRSPYQPRKELHEDDIRDLANSIKSEGLLQPIILRKVEDHYELIAGERRFRAYSLLEMKTIPARIMMVSNASAASLALIENLQREGLNPIEESMGYACLVRDFDLTQEQVAERVGKSRSAVTNALRILQLDTDIQQLIIKGLLSTGHAKVLLSLEDNFQRSTLARLIIEKNLTVRQAEDEVRKLKKGKERRLETSASISSSESIALLNLEKKLSSHLNTQVSFKHSSRKGKIVIEYFGTEDLNRIVEQIGIF